MKETGKGVTNNTMFSKVVFGAACLGVLVILSFFISGPEVGQMGETAFETDSSTNISKPDSQYQQDTKKGYTLEELAEKELVEAQEKERERARKTIAHLTLEQYSLESRYGALPAKLSGIELPKLYYDKDGNLIVTKSLSQMIEHFMIGSGEENLDISIDRVFEYAALTLPEPALTQANEIIEKYLDYKQNVDQVPDVSNVYENDKSALVDKLEIALKSRQEIRDEYLGAELSEVFYGDQQRYDEYAIERARINLDDDLNYWEKDAALASAEQQLPQQLQEKMSAKRKKRNFERRIAELEAQGADQEILHEERVNFYGEEKAQHITFLESRDEEWGLRVSQWRSEKENVENNSLLSATEKSAQLEILMSSHFDEKEKTKLIIQELEDRVDAALSNRG